KRTKDAEKYGQLKGIIWLQGGNNHNEADIYMPLLEKFVEDMRKDLGEHVIFIAGELGRWKNNTMEINKVILNIPNKITNSAVVFSDGLTPLNEDTTNPHF